MRLLAVTPYDPTMRHGHAADDIGPPFYRALAAQCELHVYAPSTLGTGVASVEFDGYVVHRGSGPNPSPSRHVLMYPAFARKDWSRRNSREVARLVEQLRPDHVHVQYVQPLEAALCLRRQDWSMTMHDVVQWVCGQRARSATGARRAYYTLEYHRARRLEQRALRGARAVFTVSPRDARWAAAYTSPVVNLGLGREDAGQMWAPEPRGYPVFVFAGAMWRDANARAAEFLAAEVLPRVRRVEPEAVLRVVGTRPAPSLLRLDGKDGVAVVGDVPSIEDEYVAADGVLAVSLVDAGVLVKALTALGCGAPVVMNETVAGPLGVVDGEHALVREGPDGMAEALLLLWADKRLASRVGAGGRQLAASRRTWPDIARALLQTVRRSA